MSDKVVTIIDYGIGNLYSVQRAVEMCGAMARVTSDPDEVEAAGCLILPGVGAFSDGMRGVREAGLVEPVRRYVAVGKPLLGICLGMQMLATVSEEFGEHEGLGLIPGRVIAVPETDVKDVRHKIPHIGWSALSPSDGISWTDTPLEETAPGTSVYLVHSYHMNPDDPAHRLAECDYGGRRVTAAIRAGRVFGCQFHPEKSGPAGLAILRRFLSC